ncbi:hypothetical protein TIFTF001_018908 [Ficus carica]|uniref:Terpene synthase metal-binding domain-containing protein n=1 Tax=Ficus carica TaxID=3494 RepID=A0AA88ABZ6_FICCA|nr:hypothetical protein TIFTF001_018908 [Ficus carica]
MFFGLVDEKGGVIEKSSHHEDVRVMLELLEALHLALECENVLHEAKAFATGSLKNSISGINNHENNTDLYKLVVYALEIPTHWRVSWFDVKWQMDSYERGIHHVRTILLDLAKLNFNIVQATLQKDLRELSRLVESFVCNVGLAFQPQYKCLRKCLTKVVNFILIVDDINDLYGSLEELERFTNVVDRCGKKYETRDHRVDVVDMQRRNWRSENRRNDRETEKQQHAERARRYQQRIGESLLSSQNQLLLTLVACDMEKQLQPSSLRKHSLNHPSPPIQPIGYYPAREACPAVLSLRSLSHD